MNELTIDAKHITLRVSDPNDWMIAERLTGSAKRIGPGLYTYATGALNLQRIYSTFTGPKKPIVKSGSFFMDRERSKLVERNRVLEKMDQIHSSESLPVEPNHLFVPYKHQSKIIGVLSKNPFAPIAADCFVEGTLIKADSKYKAIEDCEVGDVIETLHGPSVIEKTMSREYSGTTVTLETSGGFYPASATPNHNFYVLRRERCVIKSRGKNTFCSVECNRSCPSAVPPHKNYKIQKIEAKDLRIGDCLLFRQPNMREQKVDNAYLTIAAFYLSDGWIAKNKSGRPQSVHFSLHLKKEHTLAAKLVKALQDYGLEAKTLHSKAKNNVIMVSAKKSSELASKLSDHFGHLAHCKKIPPWIFALSREQKLLFLRGLFDGDCHVNLKEPVKGERLSQNIRYVTTSYALATGVRDLLLGIGVRVSGMREEAKIDKRGQRHREAFRILVPRKFMGLFGYDVKFIRKDLRQTEFEERGERYTLLPIRRINHDDHYSGRVYNLTSAGHDSYLTDIGISKNCGLGKTGSTARAVELALEAGEVMKGKILISAPLSILGTSWMDDIKKFTRLKACILREPKANRTVLSEENVILATHGPRTPEMVTVKTRTKTLYRNPKTGRVVDTMDTLTKAEGPWDKFSAKVKVGITLAGVETLIGDVVGRRATKEETKKLKITEFLADPSYDVFLINHDGVKLYQEILKEHQFAWVIVDESTKIKSPDSKVFSAHVDISWKAKRRSILTGTPNPNGFLDLWGQFYFLDRGLTLEATMRDYLAEYFQPVSAGNFMVPDGRGGQKAAVKWVIRSQADRDRLIARVRRAGIFLKQRDCIDLPPRTDMRRNVAMSAEQETAYLEMEEDLITEFRDAKTSQQIRAEAVNVLAKMMKLRQITSGFLAAGDGGLGSFRNNPKLDDLDGFIEEMGDNKLVVACQFREEIRLLLDRYKSLGVTSIDGSVKPEERDARIRDFQNTEKYRVIVLQPQAASHGITLTASSHLFLLSLDYNFEYYYQIAKRIERLGQKNSIFVIHSLATFSDGGETVDHDLMSVLEGKNKERDLLFQEQDIPDIAAALADRMIKRRNSRV